ncbi:MAG: hypothetical protein ACI867_002033 [Glaciecola sp.]
MPAKASVLAALQRLLDGSLWLGAELDLTYRVLSLTIEVPEGSDTLISGQGDRRCQILLSPSSQVAACLRVAGDPARVETFEVEQLADVVAAMGHPALSGQMIGAAEPTDWPAISVEGRSKALDGVTHRILLETTAGDRSLSLFARFDDVEVRDPSGEPVAII